MGWVPDLGEIRIFAGDYAPEGWALCDGRLLEIKGNEALFSLIGTTYGGDGQTWFALPDMRGRIGISVSDSYSLGQVGGVERVTLNVQEMPRHTHIPIASQVPGVTTDPAGMLWALSSTDLYSRNGAVGLMSSQAISMTGDNMPHDNMMTYLVVNHIIAIQGKFPDFA